MKIIRIYTLFFLCFFAFLVIAGCAKQEAQAQTAYVVTKEENILSQSSCVHLKEISLDNNGIPTAITESYSDNSVPVTHTKYYYDHSGLVEEIIKLSSDLLVQNKNELANTIEAVQKKYNDFLDVNCLEPQDCNYYILGFNSDNKISHAYAVSGEFNPGHNGEIYEIIQYFKNSSVHEKSTYFNHKILSIDTKTYDTSNTLVCQELYFPSSDTIGVIEYTYEADKTMVKHYTTTPNSASQSSGNEFDYSIQDVFDESGYPLKRVTTNFSGGQTDEILYTCERIQIPIEKVDFICNIYNYLGINYYLVE